MANNDTGPTLRSSVTAVTGLRVRTDSARMVSFVWGEEHRHTERVE